MHLQLSQLNYAIFVSVSERRKIVTEEKERLMEQGMTRGIDTDEDNDDQDGNVKRIASSNVPR